MNLLRWLTRSTNSPAVDVATQPWLAHPPWATAQIRCHSKRSLFFLGFFAVVWTALSLPISFVIPSELASGNTSILLVILFPLIGLVMLVWVVVLVRAWRRFGALVVVMDPFPGAIGGQVGGTIDLKLPYHSDYRFSVILSCIYSYMSGSGKNRSRKEKLIWQTRGFAYSQAFNAGTRLNFCFDVPPDLPASEPRATQYHLWRLDVRADLPGADLRRDFELPVFPTAEISRFQERSSSDHPDAVAYRDSLIESVLDIRQIPGGVELFFPMLRHSGMKLGLFLFGGVFAGAAFAMTYADDAPLFMVLLFGGTGAAGMVAALYGLFNSLRVRLDQTGVMTQRRWLGLTLANRTVARTEVQGLGIYTLVIHNNPAVNMWMCAQYMHICITARK